MDNDSDIKWNEYVRKAIEYSRGDVKALLEAGLRVAGPLLVITLNGIDSMGGIVYGFDRHNSKERSTTFMLKYMDLGISEKALKYIYEKVRCGLAHHCLPKSETAFGVDYDRNDNPVEEERDGSLIINANAFAHCYLMAIEDVEQKFVMGEIENKWEQLVKDFPIKTVTPRHSPTDIAKGGPLPPLGSSWTARWLPLD